MTRLPFALLPFFLALPQMASAVAQATETTLDNGLRIIVQEDHRAPVAVVQIWYRVGGADERDGMTGISHALEHLMFKRTRHLSTGEFSRIVAQRGGQENAFTTPDYTAYYQHWSAAHVPESFRLEAERMRHLLLEAGEVSNELKVIREERRLRVEDDPRATALESIMATTWQTGPYRQPVIGWAVDIENLRLEDIRAWYRRYYVPNNAIVVVVGDVDPVKTREQAEAAFGQIPAVPLPTQAPREEVPQHGLKRIEILDARLGVPMLLMNYKVPGLAAVAAEGDAPRRWEIYALDVLSAILDGGASARFSRELVRNGGLALSASADYSGVSRYPDLFSLQGIPKPGVTLARLEAALREQIRRLQETPPTPEELARVKIGVIAGSVFERDSLFGQAMMIGALAAVGLDWRSKDTYAADIEAVTAEQVQAVARKYFREEVATIAWLKPEPAGEK